MIELRRIDPAKNMHRFYRLDTQPDLFGGVFLVKQWGRIGAAGQTMAERFEDETAASAALLRQQTTKTRRGYVPARIIGPHLATRMGAYPADR